MEVTIDKGLENVRCGVYKITFSDGRFYIGSSKDLQYRIHKQRMDIQHGFSKYYCCVSLKSMKGFDGECVISLLKEVVIDKVRMFGAMKEILDVEMEFIMGNKGNSKCINWHKNYAGVL